ncbi:MAG TPA: sugar ABC transporter ATP-binding protein [Humisphaera sp.]|nr:sugar ABC transporter ATP-binding protein [Humisphaera sp.]
MTKRFPGVLALDSVDFHARAGEVHALMGENGAGKSTLIKILTGVYSYDAGQMFLDGKAIQPVSPLHAQRLRIATVYQEVNLIPALSVAENIYLGRMPKRWGGFGGIDSRAMIRGAKNSLAQLDVHIDVTKPVQSFSVALQQMVAIARSLSMSAKVLILDEPTSSLDRPEVEQLFSTMRRLKENGLAIIFVTHFLDQVYAISDRITVLRNGRLVGEHLARDLPRLKLVSEMVGRDVAELKHGGAADRQSAPLSPFVEAKGLGRSGAVGPLDLSIGRGEIVGLAGLLGSGRTETARLLFAADKPDAGTITVDGRTQHLGNPRNAIALGFAFCPEDRKVAGILPDLSIRENIVVALQARRGWWRPIPLRKQREMAEKYIAALRIATNDAEKPIRLLSGGNQQKAILARWLAASPTLLILDEPTRGIDVGAKAEISALVEKLCAEGMSLLFISSELEEVAALCSRVIVLRDRQKVGELSGSDVTEKAILTKVAG